MNLALRPRQVWPHLDAELRETNAQPFMHIPLVTILRSGDLANPAYRGNFNLIADRLCAHPGLRHCRFVGVSRAIEQFTQTQN